MVIMKKFLLSLEDFLFAVIGVTSSAGFFLIGCFITNVVRNTEVIEGRLAAIIGVVSILLAIIVCRSAVAVHYKYVDILAAEYKLEEKLKAEGKLEEVSELREHLRVK